ncbi:type II secretion system protein [Tamlana sp. 2_MG-2023]|uniref:type II secretion system protein n=1 Tax=unclassified Tamlana TaxID=2614803 RepID=UPI0026E37E33|nr:MULTISPECIES: type II secretion system protein [unclassified Tamlana]MDO6758570.1 type II secretion system protein [Tamlana sp. 2_MG-2023]MDO6789269.1 type II secretion system protein [Tamlana sp. 1_MG-2023]
MKRNKNIVKSVYVKAYSMSELVIVLCIIGILILLVLPNQTSVVAQAKAIEAQSMLNHLYGLEKSHFYRYSKYSSDFEALGFEPALSVNEGGQAVYRIEIIEASTNSFKAIAVSQSDFDGDGNFNTWEIDQNKILKETIKD